MNSKSTISVSMKENVVYLFINPRSLKLQGYFSSHSLIVTRGSRTDDDSLHIFAPIRKKI
jgi:hypothetical protein